MELSYLCRKHWDVHWIEKSPVINEDGKKVHG